MDIIFGIGKIPLFKIVSGILDTVQDMLLPLCLSGEACGLVVQSAQLAVGVSAEGLDRFLGQKQGKSSNMGTGYEKSPHFAGIEKIL